jgi:hypothetical protein
MIRPDHDDCPVDDFDENGFDPDIDCGLGPDGQCEQAGTEYCDFDCGRLA